LLGCCFYIRVELELGEEHALSHLAHTPLQKQLQLVEAVLPTSRQIIAHLFVVPLHQVLLHSLPCELLHLDLASEAQDAAAWFGFHWMGFLSLPLRNVLKHC